MQLGRPFQPRPLEQGAVEQSIHYPKGTKYFDNLHQAEGSTFHHSPVPQTINFRGPASVDTPHAPPIHSEPVYRPTWISRVTFAPVMTPVVRYEPVITPVVSYEPVITPVVSYEPALFLDNYAPHIVPQRPPMHRNQATGRASPIIPSQANQARQSREVSSFQAGIEKKIPSGTVTKSFDQPKGSKETYSPQSENISQATQSDEVRKPDDLSSSLETSERASKIPVAKSEMDRNSIHTIVGQDSVSNPPDVSLTRARVETNLQEDKSKKVELVGHIVQPKSDSNIPSQHSKTHHSAQKSAQESNFEDNVKLKLEPEVTFRKTESKRADTKKNTINEHFDRQKLVKPVKKAFSEAQKVPSHVSADDKTVVSQKMGLESPKRPSNQWKTLFVQSNKNAIDKEGSPWIMVESKRGRKGFQQTTQFSKDQKPEQVDLHQISLSSPIQLDKTKIPDQSELDKAGVRAQSQPNKEELLSPKGSPTFLFSKKNNDLNEDEENIPPLSFKNLETQENKKTSDNIFTDKFQDTSEMSSAKNENASPPRSSDFPAGKSEVLGLDDAQREIDSENPEEINKLPTAAGRKTKKKKSKKKGSHPILERQHDTELSILQKPFPHEEINSAFEASSLKVIGEAASRPPGDPKRNSPVNRKHKIQGPLPEPAYVITSETDLWESQLYASPVKLSDLSGPLRQKAQSVLNEKWEKIKDMMFTEAFSPYTKGLVKNEIYPGLTRPRLDFQATKNENFETGLSQSLAKHLKLSYESQHLTLEDLNEDVFKMLQESWFLDPKALFAKLRATLKDFEDISELHRRLNTLSRQVLQYTIVENWKTVKGWLIENMTFSESMLENVEAMFQLSTRFPDMTKPLKPLDQNTHLMDLFIENEKEIIYLLENVLGIRETRTRIAVLQDQLQASSTSAWWKQTNYMEQYKGNALNIREVVAIGTALSFDFPNFEVEKGKAADLLYRIQAIQIVKERHVLPWFTSAEYAFIMKTFKAKYETRMKQLLDIERQQRGETHKLQGTVLVHKTNRHLERLVAMEHEDMWSFLHRGLSPQFMIEMYVAGESRAKKSAGRWREFLDRAPGLLTEEQIHFAVGWLKSGQCAIKVAI
ncbi:hypothetical protein O181_048114 [Austropuccinia psidii MF-1]|uniref:Uncharacterized protein n=1 Tax=Austropuccinia psidii MF-1 TaxID=1389203 RepID=A0A9Q3DS69_9BASI|nr:hypothetical protein [Austropuccinia psidii MF-1]